MGDNGDKVDVQAEPQEIKLTITLLREGGVKVDGPITNEPIALWLIDKAKDVVKAFNMQQAMNNQPRIAKPGGMMNFARKKF